MAISHMYTFTDTTEKDPKGYFFYNMMQEKDTNRVFVEKCNFNTKDMREKSFVNALENYPTAYLDLKK